MAVYPYLFFNGACDEAIAFYVAAAGAEVVSVSRFRDAPPCPDMPPPAPETADKVMHAELRIGGSAVYASGGTCAGGRSFAGFGLSMTAPDVAAAEHLFAALAVGGRVLMPMGKTFYAPAFGMLADRFGVTWMVIVAAHA